MKIKKITTLLATLVLSASTLLAQATQDGSSNPPSNTDQQQPVNQPTTFAPDDMGFSYGGFSIDDSDMVNDPNRQAMREEIQKQIDIVEEVGLSPDILSFFQTVQIYIEPSISVMQDSPFYGNTRVASHLSQIIVLTPGILPADDTRIPYLLQQLLAIFLDQKISHSRTNVKLTKLFNHAQNKNVYESNSSLMMSDITNFFINSSTAYLFGVNNEEPFCRQKLQQNSPDLVDYLQTLFGPNTGSYQGVLAVSFSPNNGFSYGGFYIDDSQIQNMPYLEEMRTAVENQIDIVNNVGLPSDVLAFFRTLPIEVVPNGAMASAPNAFGEYQYNNNLIMLSQHDVNFSTGGTPRPTLLHESLHALHHQLLADSFKNPTILSYYQEAQASGDYDPNSWMLSDATEFFACTGATYLFGLRPSEPFTREKVEQSQPDYVQYLQQLFGPNIGNY